MPARSPKGAWNGNPPLLEYVVLDLCYFLKFLKLCFLINCPAYLVPGLLYPALRMRGHSVQSFWRGSSMLTIHGCGAPRVKCDDFTLCSTRCDGKISSLASELGSARWCRASVLWTMASLVVMGRSLLSSNCIGEAWHFCRFRWLMMVPMIDGACDSSPSHCFMFTAWIWLSAMIQGACPPDYGIAHCDGKISAFLLGKPSTTTKIEYLTAVKPTPTPLPPIFDHLRFFLFFFGDCFFFIWLFSMVWP